MSIDHTVISWLYPHMDGKCFLPQSWHISLATFSELVPWQLKVGEENHTIELTSSLLSSYLKLPIGMAW